MPINRKVKMKNQILEYHAPSLVGTIRKIQDQSMKSVLPQ